MEKTLTVAVCDDEDPALDIISAAVKRVFSTHGVEAQIDLFRRPAATRVTRRKADFGLSFFSPRL